MNDRTFSSQTGCAIVDLNHRMQWVDEPLSQLLGYQAKALIGMPFEQITHPDDLNLDSHLAERLFAGKLSTYRIEKRFIRDDKTITSLEVRASLISDVDGRPLYGVAVVTPVRSPAPGEAVQRTANDADSADAERIRRAIFD